MNPLALMGGGGLSMSSSDKLSSGGTNTQGGFYSAYAAPFSVGSGSASGSASASEGGATQSWLPWAVAGAVLVVGLAIYLKR
jgi:hypothetical protein